MQRSLQVDIGGATWLLLADRAAFWIERRWLIIADAHFGKAATFRAHGVPVPHGTTSDSLARLSRLIDHLAPAAIVFLGDLFHARQAHAPATLASLYRWREQHAALDLVLVEGNHDRAAGTPPEPLRIHVENDPWHVDGIGLCHVPRFLPSTHAVAGHLHPAIRLSGRADTLQLPCFWMRDGLTILPAFGSFTGGAVIEREEGDRVIAVTDDRVIEIPARRYDDTTAGSIAFGQNT